MHNQTRALLYHQWCRIVARYIMGAHAHLKNIQQTQGFFPKPAFVNEAIRDNTGIVDQYIQTPLLSFHLLKKGFHLFIIGMINRNRYSLTTALRDLFGG